MTRTRPRVLVLVLALLAGYALAQLPLADPAGRFVIRPPHGWTATDHPEGIVLARANPVGTLHVIATDAAEGDALAQAIAYFVGPDVDASDPLDTVAYHLPSGAWTQRVYRVGDDLLAAISQVNGGTTFLVLARATLEAFVQAVTAATDEVLWGFEVRTPPLPPAPRFTPAQRIEEVTFASVGATLAGVLSLPAGPAPRPAVVLVAGSGPQDRDGANEALPDYRPLRWLADHLTAAGFAVLRWDERGVGASTGDHASATTADLAVDVAAGIAYLRARADVDAARVGVVGHSEGGAIAARVAAAAPLEVAFVVSLAGPAVPYADVVVNQAQRINAAQGAGPDTVAEAAAHQARVVELALAEDWEGLELFLADLTRAHLATLPDPEREVIDDVDGFVAQYAASGTAAFQSPWMRYFLRYDPAEAWSRVTVPVLAVFAERDVQIDLDQNRAPLEAALARAGNGDLTIMVFPEANHLFQWADSGHVDEYQQLEMAFIPGFLEAISSWLKERFAPGSGDGPLGDDRPP
jgi:uncharacterized protein